MLAPTPDIFASLPLPLLTLTVGPTSTLHAANAAARKLFSVGRDEHDAPSNWYAGRTRDEGECMEESLVEFTRRVTEQEGNRTSAVQLRIPEEGEVWYDTTVWGFGGDIDRPSFAILLLRRSPVAIRASTPPAGTKNRHLPHLQLPTRPSYSSSLSSSSQFSPRTPVASTGGSDTATEVDRVASGSNPWTQTTFGMSCSAAGIKMSSSIPSPSPLTSSHSHPPPPHSIPQSPPPPPQLSSAHLLRLTAFEHLPGKAFIISNSTFTSGYLSPMVFEFLTGHASDPGLDNNFDRGVWSFDEGSSALDPGPDQPVFAAGQTYSSAWFPSTGSSSSVSDRMDPFDVQRFAPVEPIVTGRLAVTNILKRAMEQSRVASGRPEASFPTSPGAKESKKPYKVFNSSFSQRILDPLDPLLTHACNPSIYGSPQPAFTTQSNHVIVGIEVDTSTPSSPRRQIVRRLLEVTNAPLSHAGVHIGGMLLLRDVTVGQGGGPTHPNDLGCVAKPHGIEGDTYFRHTLDNLPSIVWTTDAHGKHEFFNQRWYEFTGIEPEDSLSGGWKNVFHPVDLELSIQAWHASVAAGTVYSTEYRCRHKSGSWKWMLGRALPHKDLDGNIQGWVGMCTDIDADVRIRTELTDSQEARSQLLASEKAAQEASRLKSSFVSNMSHELRTPVAGIIGMAELLLSEPDAELSCAHRLAIAKISRSGDHLLEMIGMTLDMSKVEAGKLELERRPFLIQDVIADAGIFSMAATKKGLDFSIESCGLFEERVLGDMPRLGQVLGNLLSNAIKFTPTGTVTLDIIQVRETTSSIDIKMVVRDTGIGISEQALPKLFLPFHQADASTSRIFGGTGLGLAITKSLVELMGGSISLESTYGQGSTMTVLLPLQKAPLEPTSLDVPIIDEQDPCKIHRESIWILVAEDNELLRTIFIKSLQNMRFNVEAVCDGLEAIAALQRRRFDLILMDRQMPRLDGDEATKQIRQLSDPFLANIKIIALTASAMQGDEEICLALGMNGYLSKPVRSKLLEATILRHLAARTSSSRRSSASMDLSFAALDETGHRLPSHPSYDVPVFIK